MIDIDIEMQLKEHLDKDERLLWGGGPRKGIVFRPSDMLLIPFSILWCGFAIFWTIEALQAAVLFGLFGVPFVIMGLVLVFGRFIIDAKQRANTTYGITNKRILIKSGVFNQTITSVNIRSLSNMKMTEKGDGSGSIELNPATSTQMGMSGMGWWPGAKGTPSLTLIPDVRSVYQQILNLQKEG